MGAMLFRVAIRLGSIEPMGRYYSRFGCATPGAWRPMAPRDRSSACRCCRPCTAFPSTTGREGTLREERPSSAFGTFSPLRREKETHEWATARYGTTRSIVSVQVLPAVHRFPSPCEAGRGCRRRVRGERSWDARVEISGQRASTMGRKRNLRQERPSSGLRPPSPRCAGRRDGDGLTGPRDQSSVCRCCRP